MNPSHVVNRTKYTNYKKPVMFGRIFAVFWFKISKKYEKLLGKKFKRTSNLLKTFFAFYIYIKSIKFISLRRILFYFLPSESDTFLPWLNIELSSKNTQKEFS